MKQRILSYLLIVVMVLSISASAAEVKDMQDVTQTEAVSFLTELGVMHLNDGSFLPRELMTRAEYVDAVLRLVGLNIEDYPRSYNTDIYDVTEYTDYGCAVLFALDMGIVNGNGDGTFSPEETITVRDAVVILVRALGYEPIAAHDGGYTAGYLTRANRLGLLRGVDTDGELNRENCAVLLYNALETEILRAVAYGGDGIIYRSVEGQTVLDVYHHIGMVSGMVAQQTYQMETEEQEEEGLLWMEDGTRILYDGTEDYAGELLDIYYRENTITGEKTFFRAEQMPNVRVLTLDAYDTAYSNHTYTYGDNQTAKIGSKTRIFYNGIELTSYDEALLNPALGTIKLMQYESGYYQIAKITAYTDCVVEATDVNNMWIYDAYSADRNLAYENLNYVTVDAEGKAYDLSLVQKGMVLSVAKSADGTKARILVSNGEVAGSLVKISGTDAEPLATIGETEYRVAPGFVATFQKQMQLGKEYTLYLNAFGMAAGFSAGADNRYEIAYLIDVTQAPGNFTKALRLKLYTGENGVIELDTAEKLTLNGVAKTDAASCLTSLSESQLIRYYCNDGGKITAIDTAYSDSVAYLPEEGENSLYKYYSADSSEYHSSSSTFNGYVVKTDNTRFFLIPQDPKTADPDDFTSDVTIISGDTYSIEAFKTQKDSFYAEVILVYESDNAVSFSHSNRPIMVNGTYQALNEDGENVTYITGFQAGVIQDYELKADCTSTDGSDPTEIQGGDVIRALVDSKDRIYLTSMIWDRSKEESFGFTSNPTHAEYNYYSRFMYASVHSGDGAYFKITYDSNPSLTPDSAMQAFRVSKVGAFYIYGENKDGTWFKKGSVSDLIPWKNNPTGYSKVLIRQYYGAPHEVIIFNP